MRRYLAFAVACVAMALMFAGQGRAANWLEQNFWLSGPNYSADVPLCDSQWALWKIQGRFGEKEGRYWRSDLRIVAFEEVRETAFRPWQYSTIPRRFCSGRVQVNDGTRHKIYYWIGEDTGWIGAFWGVEWCVVGLDRNWAYNPACKMAQP